MGPQAFARGDELSLYNEGELMIASMGPQAFARGDVKPPGQYVLVAALQWGRRLSPAETHMLHIRLIQIQTLQWGRRLSPAETSAAGPPIPSRPCFNGAAGFRPWRHGDDRGHRFVANSLQWGRRLSPAETDMSLVSLSYEMGFNGAAGFRPRRLGCHGGHRH